MSAPYAKDEVTLCVEGVAVSQPFIDMTTSLMRRFGVDVIRKQSEAGDTYHVPKVGFQIVCKT